MTTFVGSTDFISPAPLPVINNAQPNLQVTLSNRLALQLGKLFQDLFPIYQDFEQEASYITNVQQLSANQDTLIEDVLQIKATILLINQITNLATSRIPNGFPTGNRNSDPTIIAGLNTNAFPNPVLNTVNNIYLDIITEGYEAAQSDYATLRNQLRPYFNL